MASMFPSVILGRAIKNEYLALGTLLSTAGLTFASLGGSKKDAHAPSGSGKQSIEQVKESVKFSAGSRYVALVEIENLGIKFFPGFIAKRKSCEYTLLFSSKFAP